MKQLVILLGVLLLSLRLQAQEIKETVHFATGRHVLKADDLRKLDKLVTIVQNKPGYQVEISGHTDYIAGEAYNDRLSMQRAGEVKQYLVRKGLSAERITIRSYGEHKPVAENENSDGRSLNRRAEITAHWTDISKMVEKEVALNDNKQASTTTIEDLYRQLSHNINYFTIQPDKDTVLVTQKGTLLYYYANSLDVLRGCNEARLTVEDIDEPSEMVISRATTTAEGKWLETRGMLHITAEDCNGKTNLKPGSKMIIFRPSKSFTPMLLWNAREDSTKVLDWKTKNKKTPVTMIRADWMSKGGCGSCGGVRCPFFFCGLKNILLAPVYWGIVLVDDIAGKGGRRNWAGTAWGKPDAKSIAKGKDELKKIMGKAYDNRGKLPVKPDPTVNYYIYSLVDLNWTNLDIYASGTNAINFEVNLKPDSTNDLKLIYKNKSLVPADNPLPGQSTYHFHAAPLGARVTLIALRYENGVPALAVKKVLISKETDYDLEFKTYKTVEELEKAVKDIEY